MEIRRAEARGRHRLFAGDRAQSGVYFLDALTVAVGVGAGAGGGFAEGAGFTAATAVVAGAVEALDDAAGPGGRGATDACGEAALVAGSGGRGVADACGDAELSIGGEEGVGGAATAADDEAETSDCSDPGEPAGERVARTARKAAPPRPTTPSARAPAMIPPLPFGWGSGLVIDVPSAVVPELPLSPTCAETACGLAGV